MYGAVLVQVVVFLVRRNNLASHDRQRRDGGTAGKVEVRCWSLAEDISMVKLNEVSKSVQRE
jgi:hypothetical protein